MYTHFFLSFIKKNSVDIFGFMWEMKINTFLFDVFLEAVLCCDIKSHMICFVFDLHDNNNQFSYITVQVAWFLL